MLLIKLITWMLVGAIVGALGSLMAYGIYNILILLGVSEPGALPIAILISVGLVTVSITRPLDVV